MQCWKIIGRIWGFSRHAPFAKREGARKSEGTFAGMPLLQEAAGKAPPQAGTLPFANCRSDPRGRL